LNETELAEIEVRMLEYPVEARRDIIKLISELRGLDRFKAEASAAASPLYDVVTGLLNAGAFGVRFAGARARCNSMTSSIFNTRPAQRACPRARRSRTIIL